MALATVPPASLNRPARDRRTGFAQRLDARRDKAPISESVCTQDDDDVPTSGRNPGVQPVGRCPVGILDKEHRERRLGASLRDNAAGRPYFPIRDEHFEEGGRIVLREQRSKAGADVALLVERRDTIETSGRSPRDGKTASGLGWPSSFLD